MLHIEDATCSFGIACAGDPSTVADPEFPTCVTARPPRPRPSYAVALGVSSGDGDDDGEGSQGRDGSEVKNNYVKSSKHPPQVSSADGASAGI